MDPVILSRLQFALATFFHFLYVPMTLGLSLFIAIMQTRYYKTGDEMYKAQAKFWGKIFLINFALGVVTGITLEFQFGTNWSAYSVFVGDIFGSLLAIEATVAFFLESTFIAVWAFGWERVSKKVHLASIWLVALAGNLSALWILLANGFMQNPVGYKMSADGSRAELESFMAVITNPYGWHMFFHTVLGAMLVAAFAVMGISAWHVFKRNEVKFFHASFKLGLSFALVASILAALVGHQLGQVTAKYQPTKLAAAESLWDTQEGASMYVILVPSVDGTEANLVELIKVPGFLSLMATNHMSGPESKVTGLKDIPKEDRPPVWPVFLAFRAMLGLGCLFIGVSVISFLFIRNRMPDFKYTLLGYVLMIPLPYLAMQFGWIVTEMGRQPWVVYGKMRTAAAVSSQVDWTSILGTLGVMGAVYTLLTILGFGLMTKAALKGPAAVMDSSHYGE